MEDKKYSIIALVEKLNDIINRNYGDLGIYADITADNNIVFIYCPLSSDEVAFCTIEEFMKQFE